MEHSLFHASKFESDRILYTPSAFARESLIHLQETGKLTAQSPHESHRENLTSFLFIIVENGSGELHYLGKTYDAHKGDCIFIDCSNSYSHKTSEDLWTLRWIHFYGPNMKEIYDKYCERGGQPVFRPDEATKYSDLLFDIYRIAKSNNYIRDMLLYENIVKLLSNLMLESWSDKRPEKQKSSKKDISAIKEYVDENYKKKLSLDEIADSFYINKFHMERQFKELYGMSIGAYLIHKRITRAKELLRFSDASMDAIAIECGMTDANYFSRIFKKVEGIPPTEYRRQWTS